MNAKAASLKRGISKVRRLWREDRHDLALVEVNRLLELSPNSPYLLVQRAALIQLHKGVQNLKPSDLDDVKEALDSAVALDPESPNALIELGYLHFAYVSKDGAKTAAKHFERAVKLSADLFAQALVGYAEALSELGEKSKAQSAVLEASTVVLRHRAQMTEHVVDRILELLQSSLQVGSNGKNDTHESDRDLKRPRRN